MDLQNINFSGKISISNYPMILLWNIRLVTQNETSLEFECRENDCVDEKQMRWFDAKEDSCQMYHNRVPDCRDQLIFWKGASREGGQVMCGYDDILSPNSVVGGCNEGDTDSNG